MDCSFCGSQDTTYKSGTTKTGKNVGEKWEAYDCNEKECKNEKGYPNRTWVPRARAGKPKNVPPGLSNAKIGPYQPSSEIAKDDILNRAFANINTKLDKIIALLGNREEAPF